MRFHGSPSKIAVFVALGALCLGGTCWLKSSDEPAVEFDNVDEAAAAIERAGYVVQFPKSLSGKPESFFVAKAPFTPSLETSIHQPVDSPLWKGKIYVCMNTRELRVSHADDPHVRTWGKLFVRGEISLMDEISAALK